jgi:two-component system NtrC family sensor kinase
MQRKYTDAALATLLTFASVAVAALVVVALVCWRLSATIAGPVHALAEAAETVGKGEFAVPVRAEEAYAEIGMLIRAFDAMSRSLHERDEQLKHHTRMQLTRSERLAAAGRLAAGIAHEINNPLTGVLTFSHMLLRDTPPGSQQREDLQAIIDATTRCRDVVRGMLNFSRQNEPQKDPCQINTVMTESLRLTRNQALVHGIKVVEEFAPDLPEAVLDPHQIQEVAVNAILNAIDAMGEGGTLTIRTGGGSDNLGPYVWFSIGDTGCGISIENLEHVFDPFFTTKPAGKGTGLGLAISYGIVTEHDGDINIESKEGEGTTVRVRLPLTPKED